MLSSNWARGEKGVLRLAIKLRAEPSALDAIASVSLNWAGRSWRTDSESFFCRSFFLYEIGSGAYPRDPAREGGGLARNFVPSLPDSWAKSGNGTQNL